MHYIYQLLAVILIGISVGALLSRRDMVLMVGSAIAIVLGVVTLIMPAWWSLVVGLIVYLGVQMTQRDTRDAASAQSSAH